MRLANLQDGRTGRSRRAAAPAHCKEALDRLVRQQQGTHRSGAAEERCSRFREEAFSV